MRARKSTKLCSIGFFDRLCKAIGFRTRVSMLVGGVAAKDGQVGREEFHNLNS